MIATFINCGLILFGSILGLLFRNRISARFTDIVTQCLALCVLAIGFSSAIATNNILCVIVCLVIGSLLGEALGLETKLDGFGDLLRTRLIGEGGDGDSRFTEGFITASVLFCVGAMSVMGAIEAGVNGNYSILISKSVIDGITAITLAAAMGMGVAFSAIPILIYQGGLTLLAGLVAAFLTTPMITEMSAVGGLIIIGIGFNMLGLPTKKVKVVNMIPAIFLPLLYLPAQTGLAKIFSHLF